MAGRPTPPSGTPRRRQVTPAPGGWVWLLLIGLIVIMTFYATQEMGSSGRITYSDFLKLLDKGQVTDVTLVGKERIVGKIRSLEELPEELSAVKAKLTGNQFATERPAIEDGGRLQEKLERAGVQWKGEPESGAWLAPLFWALPFLLILAFFLLFILPRMRDPLGGGFLSSYIKSPARRYERTKMRITFEDVADMENAKRELQEVVEYLRSPEKFQRIGAEVPKGVLLVGPPGTGKTLLARAVAGEAGVPFFSISGSEFIQMFVGVGASRVRDLFKTAKESTPALIFIDEIDAVGRMRGAGVGGGSDEREQTLNQILSEMDGFHPNEMVIVIAATNRPDVLDSALLRPGRFDRHITIDRPTWQGRLEILKIHTRTKPLGEDVNLEHIARKMIGMTGADLRNLANEAALLAARENKMRIERQDFERAADRVLLGPKREEVLTEDDKRRTAYHEAGHTLVGYYEPAADPPRKVTIVPRGRTGGVTMFSPDEDRMHHGFDYFKAQLSVAMGGRAAERLIYNQTYAGVEADLKQATRLARYMVTHWGMSDRLGPMAFRQGEEHVFLGKEIQEPRDFSEGTAQMIDEEVQRLLREADERAFQILEERRDELARLVEALLQKEELLKEEIEEILGIRRPSPADGDGPPLTVVPADNGTPVGAYSAVSKADG